MKKLLAILLTITTIFTASACSNDKSTQSSNKANSNEKSDSAAANTDADTGISNSEPEKTTYESETLVFSGNQYQNKDTFVRFLEKTASSYITTDNKVYDINDSIPFFDGADVKEYLYFGNTIAYKDSKDFIHITKNGTEYVCSNIKGEIIHAFRGSMDGLLYVFSFENKTLYLNGFKSNGIKDKYDNSVVTLYDLDDKLKFTKIDRLDVVESTLTWLYVEANGKKYYDSFSSVYGFQGKPEIWTNQVNNQADKVLSYGYNHSMTSPLYTKKGNETTVFYCNVNDELPISLPEGYKVSDIQQAILAYTTVLMFKDGSVYTAQLTHNIAGPTLVKNEELSAIGAKGEIKEIYVSTYRDQPCSVKVLLNDNALYEVVTNETDE